MNNSQCWSLVSDGQTSVHVLCFPFYKCIIIPRAICDAFISCLGVDFVLRHDFTARFWIYSTCIPGFCNASRASLCLFAVKCLITVTLSTPTAPLLFHLCEPCLMFIFLSYYFNVYISKLPVDLLRM